MEEAFPPPVIKRWIERRSVNTKHLTAELRAWADWFEAHEPDVEIREVQFSTP